MDTDQDYFTKQSKVGTRVFTGMDELNPLLDSLDEALIILDSKGKILLLNRTVAKLNGSLFVKQPQEESVFIDFIVPEVKSSINGFLQEIVTKRVPEKHYSEVKNKFGTTVFLELNLVPNRVEETLAHVYVVIRDTTVQKVFEKKLINQAANITNLFEKANAIVIGLDTSGYVTEWNAHCEKITGFTKDDVYGQKFVDVLMIGIDAEKFEGVIKTVLSRKYVNTQEQVIGARDGTLITLLLSYTPRLSSSDQVIGLTLVGQDVTELTEYRTTLEMKVEERTRELKRALEKEQEVVEMKSRFVSIASHEFRSPLSSIQFQTEQIARTKGKISRGDLEKRLRLIEKQTKHMFLLLDDVLAYGKRDSAKIQVDFTSILLPDFLNKIVEEVGHVARKSKHSVKTEYTFLADVISTDEKLLRSILINLLTNAIKFSPGKEWVYFTVDNNGSQLVITVRDEGIGVPKDEMNKIFEPFQRGKSVGTIQGTGLGLAIVKKSVELLNGTLKMDSEEGKGTTFIIVLPL